MYIGQDQKQYAYAVRAKNVSEYNDGTNISVDKSLFLYFYKDIVGTDIKN